MQTDRNARKYVTYEPVQTEMSLVNLPSSSADPTMTSPNVEDSSAYRLAMSKYDSSEDNLLGYSIAFLGSGKVGKTSILQQFLSQEYNDRYVPTATCVKYRKAVYMDGRIYNLTLRDCPGVAHFPADTVTEWSECQGFYGLHLSQVYVLVYDTSNDDTFNYVKSMREQILECKGSETMIVVVGNKQDLSDPRNSFIKSSMQPMSKKWKCPFVFCSAKYNWHIINVFEVILKTIEAEMDAKKETGSRTTNRWRNAVQCKVS